MAKFYFPQLTSGAIAQYPIQKVKVARTVKNVLPDGSMILYPDPNAARLVWQLSYTDLALVDMQAIQEHFNACLGPLHAFTFIDPTENMLISSSDLTNAAWQLPSSVTVSSGISDPEDGTGGFVVTNTGQGAQEISQSFQIPANWQYCFSAYLSSGQGSTITLIRNGSSAEEDSPFSIGSEWARVVSSGALNDPGTEFTVALRIGAGQQIGVYGLQLEAQLAPSRYRPTSQTGGVYANAHWAVDELTIVAEAPNLFSTSFSIEAAI